MPVKIIKKFPDIKTPGFSFTEWDKQFHLSNVIINDSCRSVYFPSHWTALSMKCTFGGTEHYIMGRMKYSVDESLYLLLNEGTKYESLINSENAVESFTLNFTRKFAEDVCFSLLKRDDFLLDNPLPGTESSVNFFEKLYPHTNRTYTALKELRNLARSNTTDLQLLDEHLRFILEFLLYEHIKTLNRAESVDGKKRSTRMEIFRRLNLAKDYMYSNYHEKIELVDLGKISNLAPHYLLRKFKKHFGTTPHRYLTSRRLEAAKELLLRTNKSVTEICNDVGFESLSSFGALFKKHYHYPPEKYKFSALT